MYLARYSASGELEYVAHSINAGTGASALAAGPDGSLFVAGTTGARAVFGPGEPGEVDSASVENPRTFLARYRTDGTLDWLRFGGGIPATHWVDGVSTTADGAWTVGRTTEPMTFNLGQPDQSAADYTSEAYAYHSYLVHHDLSGALRGHIGIPDSRVASVVGLDEGGAVVVGTFGEDTQRTTLTDASGTTLELTSLGASDSFLARFGSARELRWAKTIGGNVGSQVVSHVTVSPDGTLFVAGSFAVTATFGAGEPQETTLTAAETDAFDAFVAQYSLDGAFIKVTRLGGAGNQQANAVFVHQVAWLLTGSFDAGGPLVLGAGEAHETTLTSAGGYDAFLALFAR